jgi:signal transduction histidine kinase
VADHRGRVEGVVVNARDITDTRKLEEQLIQSQRIESIGTLAGGVAHEINNPINGIMNYAQLILDSLDRATPAAEFAREIVHETERISRIVRNLLTFARHEKQAHSPALLADIVSAVLSLIQTVMRHDQIALEVAIAEDLPKIKCRSQQIQQVIMNLLTNARDALNERYPGFDPDKKIAIGVRQIEKEGRRYIRTTVEDHGNGILPEVRERIFDPFFSTKGKGTGLGLSISYGIVRDHGGELTVESEPGRHTRFHMDLCVDNGWTLPGKGDNQQRNGAPQA